MIDEDYKLPDLVPLFMRVDRPSTKAHPLTGDPPDELFGFLNTATSNVRGALKWAAKGTFRKNVQFEAMPSLRGGFVLGSAAPVSPMAATHYLRVVGEARKEMTFDGHRVLSLHFSEDDASLMRGMEGVVPLPEWLVYTIDKGLHGHYERPFHHDKKHPRLTISDDRKLNLD